MEIKGSGNIVNQGGKQTVGDVHVGDRHRHLHRRAPTSLIKVVLAILGLLTAIALFANSEVGQRLVNSVWERVRGTQPAAHEQTRPGVPNK